MFGMRAGKNKLAKLDSVLYLRQFKSLRLVNLAGNPFCNDNNYRCSSVLASFLVQQYQDCTRNLNGSSKAVACAYILHAQHCLSLPNSGC